MASVYIVRRKLTPDAKGKPRFRYHVRAQLHPDDPAIHLGSYPGNETRSEAAEARQKRAYAEIAAGIRPERAFAKKGKPKETMSELAARWLATREDDAANTRKHFKTSIAHIEKEWGDTDPASISVDDVQAWILGQKPAKPGTVGLRLSTLSQIFDYGEIEPNPVKHHKLRKPKQKRTRHRMPTKAELVKLYAALGDKYVAPVQLIEQTGARVGEVVSLTWGHWNNERKLLKIEDAKTAAGERLIVQVDGLPDLGERPKGKRACDRVFPDISDDSVRAAMARACKAAGIRLYSPHDLRHLSASRLWHDHKLSRSEIADRLGHSSSQITLTTYAKSLPPEEE